MKSTVISERWFPRYGFGAECGFLADNVFCDYDQQAEQLTGHEQSYLQLTSGAFRGRFLSLFLGPDAAVHMEFCNQGLEQEVIGASDHISFGVVLNAPAPFVVMGQHMSDADVFVLPPLGHLHLVSPVNGSVMAVAIRKTTLLKQNVLSPALADWLEHLSGKPRLLKAPGLAARLREDAISAMECAIEPETRNSDRVAGRALIASIASKLSLDVSMARLASSAEDRVFERFLQCRTSLKSRSSLSMSANELAQFTNVSKRSVQQAFSSHVAMGPLAYLRLLKLHDVRRKLTDRRFCRHSIGDIAALHGFWDGSRFARQYRSHFGELPSATRSAAMAEEQSPVR
ncbi:helix-turn-helix domain-containing protein [Roseibium album]|uniref:helix-turn-helix domain-containing protein n=1 Tax=Roseibium album TaxID=311410 RepID=UPI000D54D77B|nr:AraC family ethanolamine operon transcriptional activator [Labrenzia sp. EL_162]MBG6193129.1 AraC family ethanolamine operon transcriptional activator [Labrenzia sp. EL_159]